MGGKYEDKIKKTYAFLNDQYDSVLFYATRLQDSLYIGIAYAKLGRLKEAKALIDLLKAGSESSNALAVGIVYAWMNDKPKAMEYLNKAFIQREVIFNYIKVEKIFDPFRNDENFKELLGRMGVD